MSVHDPAEEDGSYLPMLFISSIDVIMSCVELPPLHIADAIVVDAAQTFNYSDKSSNFAE